MVQITWRFGSEHHHVLFLAFWESVSRIKAHEGSLSFAGYWRSEEIDWVRLFGFFKSRMCDVRLSGVGSNWAFATLLLWQCFGL
jgi:hypothetical protein